MNTNLSDNIKCNYNSVNGKFQCPNDAIEGLQVCKFHTEEFINRKVGRTRQTYIRNEPKVPKAPKRQKHQCAYYRETKQGDMVSHRQCPRLCYNEFCKQHTEYYIEYHRNYYHTHKKSNKVLSTCTYQGKNGKVCGRNTYNPEFCGRHNPTYLEHDRNRYWKSKGKLITPNNYDPTIIQLTADTAADTDTSSDNIFQFEH